MSKFNIPNKLDVDLIFIDLDDTLIDVGKPKIHDLNYKAIEQAKAENKVVVLCTGRNLDDSLLYAKALKLDYHICFGGSLVYDVQNEKIIHFDQLSKQELNNLITQNIFDNKGVFATFHAIDLQTGKIHNFFNGQSNVHFDQHEIIRSDFVEIEDLNKISDLNIFKINVFGVDAILDVFTKNIETLTDLNVIRNYPEVVEITSQQINKGKAGKWLGKLLNIDFQKTLAFGDSHNDVSLFKVVKYGITVANAVPELKQMAFAQTDTQKQQGVGKALYKWILKTPNN